MRGDSYARRTDENGGYAPDSSAHPECELQSQRVTARSPCHFLRSHDTEGSTEAERRAAQTTERRDWRRGRLRDAIAVRELTQCIWDVFGDVRSWYGQPPIEQLWGDRDGAGPLCVRCHPARLRWSGRPSSTVMAPEPSAGSSTTCSTSTSSRSPSPTATSCQREGSLRCVDQGQARRALRDGAADPAVRSIPAHLISSLIGEEPAHRHRADRAR